MDLWVRDTRSQSTIVIYQLSNPGDLLYVSKPQCPHGNGDAVPTLQSYRTDKQNRHINCYQVVSTR